MAKQNQKKITSAREILHRRLYKGNEQRIAERDATWREMALGDKIRRLREDAGITQQRVADELGTQRSAISRIEDADYDDHSMETLRRVAELFDMRLIIDFQPKHPTKREWQES